MTYYLINVGKDVRASPFLPYDIVFTSLLGLEGLGSECQTVKSVEAAIKPHLFKFQAFNLGSSIQTSKSLQWSFFFFFF